MVVVRPKVSNFPGCFTLNCNLKLLNSSYNELANRPVRHVHEVLVTFLLESTNLSLSYRIAQFFDGENIDRFDAKLATCQNFPFKLSTVV